MRSTCRQPLQTCLIRTSCVKTGSSGCSPRHAFNNMQRSYNILNELPEVGFGFPSPWLAITSRRANRCTYSTSGTEQGIRHCFADVIIRGYITSATQTKPIKTTQKCHYVYRIYLKDRGCWDKRRAFNSKSPLIVSHATHGILLAFTSLIRDLGIELCALSLKLCGCNFVAGIVNQLNLWYQNLLLISYEL